MDSNTLPEFARDVPRLAEGALQLYRHLNESDRYLTMAPHDESMGRYAYDETRTLIRIAAGDIMLPRAATTKETLDLIDEIKKDAVDVHLLVNSDHPDFQGVVGHIVVHQGKGMHYLHNEVWNGLNMDMTQEKNCGRGRREHEGN